MKHHDGPLSRLELPLALELPAFTGGHDGGWIEGFAVHLHLQDFALFIDQEGNSTRCVVLRVVNAELFGKVATPVTQDGKLESFFFRPGGVAEGAVHTYTQNLGVC